MRRNTAFAGALVAALIFACSSGKPRPPAPARVACAGALPDDELEVVTATVQPDARTGLAMIAEGTWNLAIGWTGVHEREETRTDLWKKVDKRCIAAASAPMPMLPDSERPEGFDADEFWSWFWRTHPGFEALVSVSRVGFSSDRTEAILHVSVGCGPLCGHAGFVRLSRRDGRWLVDERPVQIMY